MVSAARVREVLASSSRLAARPMRAGAGRVRPRRRAGARATRVAPIARARLRGDPHVLEDRDLREDVRDLEGLGDAETVDRLRREPAISRPRNRTRPTVGTWSPEMTLKSVDLPAPFAHHREDLSPAGRRSSPSRGAARAPKLGDVSTSRTTPSAPSPAAEEIADPEQPLAEQDDEDRTRPINDEIPATYDETFPWSRTKNTPPTTGPATSRARRS